MNRAQLQAISSEGLNLGKVKVMLYTQGRKGIRSVPLTNEQKSRPFTGWPRKERVTNLVVKWLLEDTGKRKLVSGSRVAYSKRLPWSIRLLSHSPDFRALSSTECFYIADSVNTFFVLHPKFVFPLQSTLTVMFFSCCLPASGKRQLVRNFLEHKFV